MGTKKVVINKCYGGFSLSHEASMEMAKRRGIEIFAYVDSRFSNISSSSSVGSINTSSKPRYVLYDPEKHGSPSIGLHYATKEVDPMTEAKLSKYYYDGSRNFERDDPILVAVVEEMGPAADGQLSELSVVEIPDDVQFEIEEYDGQEWVAEVHQTWS